MIEDKILDITNPRYNFMFKIQVFQYLVHEFGLGFTKHSGWDSVSLATAAMDNYLEKHGREFVPRLSNLFKETRTERLKIPTET